MAKILCTFWPFLLNILGVQIFRTCFADSVDEDGENHSLGAKIASGIFAAGVYVILATSSLLPQSFRKPNIILFSLYEILATSFCLEFVLTCVWNPIDVLFRMKLPCNVFEFLGTVESMNSCVDNFNKLENIFIPIPLCLLASIFFLTSLHVTKAVNFSVIKDKGPLEFFKHARIRLVNKVLGELPKSWTRNYCRCKKRRNRSKIRSDDYFY